MQFYYSRCGITTKPVPAARLIMAICSRFYTLDNGLKKGYTEVLHAIKDEGCGASNCMCLRHLKLGTKDDNM